MSFTCCYCRSWYWFAWYIRDVYQWGHTLEEPPHYRTAPHHTTPLLTPPDATILLPRCPWKTHFFTGIRAFESSLFIIFLFRGHAKKYDSFLVDLRHSSVPTNGQQDFPIAASSFLQYRWSTCKNINALKLSYWTTINITVLLYCRAWNRERGRGATWWPVFC